MYNVKFLFFKLKHCKELPNQALLALVGARNNVNLEELSADRMARLSGLKGNKKIQFIKSYQEILDHNSEWEVYYQQTNFLFILDEAYPSLLREIYNPPVGLFYQGDIKLLETSCIAIVGSREASGYGRDIIKEIVPGLVRKQITLVSGLAKGIDTAVHQQAIYNKGKTIGVIGSGLDVTYPKDGSHLQRYMGQRQLIVTEYPKGTPPLAFHFPQRNRIIAGLSLGTCVIEAKVRSGSLITASLSLEMGREVYAVPGSILRTGSIGCLKLIQEGAKCVTSANDILEELIYKI